MQSHEASDSARVTTYGRTTCVEFSTHQPHEIGPSLPGAMTVGADSGDTLLATAGSDTVERSSTYRFTAADLRPTSRPGSVIDTVRTVGSGARPAIVREHDIVTADGMDMHVKTAVAMGYLRKTADSIYEDASSTKTEQAAEDSEQDTIESGAVHFDAATEAAAAEFAERIPSPMQDRIVANVLGGRAVDPSMAESLGMNSEEFAASLSKIQAAYSAQANQAISALGANPAEFVTWAQTNNLQAFQSAMREHFYARNPNVYRPLVEQFFTKRSPAIETLKAAGIAVSKAHNGENLVTINGVTVTRQVAARLGWV